MGLEKALASLKNLAYNVRKIMAANSAFGKKLVQGILCFPGFNEYTITGDIWETDPFKNRTWRWRVHSFAFLYDLIEYYKVSRDMQALNTGAKLITSWISRYKDSFGACEEEFPWHDHATALRCEAMICFLNAILRLCPQWRYGHATFIKECELSIDMHANILFMEEFYSKHTNHGLEQCRVLLLCATRKHSSVSLLWKRTAVQRIVSEFFFSFTSEGIHKENSPAYHIFVLKIFISIFSSFPDEFREIRDEYLSTGRKALDFIARILRPDGLLPIIGDTELLPTTDAYHDEFSIFPEYHFFRYVCSSGLSSMKGFLPGPQRVFPISGYAIFRDGWPENGSWKNMFHIVVTAGILSGYHSHCDDGSFVVYAFGEDWIIDSGMYNHNQKDSIRRYMRSRAAHNIPIIENAIFKDISNRVNSWEIFDYSEDDRCPFCSIKILNPLNVCHLRRFHFDARDKIITICDQITQQDDVARRVIFLFHIPNDKKIRVSGKKVIVTSQSAKKMYVVAHSDSPLKIRICSGIKHDRHFSVISEKFGKYIDSNVVQYISDDVKSIEVHFLLSFTT